MKKGDNKKFLLNVIVISAVALSIAAIFTPISSFDMLDYYDSKDIQDPESHWSLHSYFFLAHYTFNKGSRTAERYGIFHVLYYDTPEWGELNSGGNLVAKYGSVPSSNALNVMSFLVFGALGLFAYFYFCFKSLKVCGKKKTKFFLYSGIIGLAVISSSIISLNFNLNFLYNSSLSDFIRLDYGFYYIVIASVLFIIAYFTQTYLVDFSEEKPNIEKVFFEKYKKE